VILNLRDVRERNTDRFRELFQDVPVAEAMYSGALTKVARHLREMSAVCHFLSKRGIAWRPPWEGGAQHYDEEMRQFLADARRNFADCSAMLKALDDYEREIGDLLEEE
jgi:hypothetical protein